MIENTVSENTSPVKNKNSKFEATDFDQKLVLLCQFCGGKNCKEEDYTLNTKQPNAIEGLHSNWITPDILAMQRPSERLIKQFGLYEQFKRNKIITILNLQEPGEHAYCGDGIIGNCGFSYIPQNLYKHGIGFYNTSWEDMTATTPEFMMKILDVFSHTFQQGGRIAVHCHAGRGRTLLAICSWLIYDGQYSAEEVIALSIEKRQGVLSKASQRQFLRDFQKYLQKRRLSFRKNDKFTFQTLVSQQQQILLKHQKKECGGSAYIITIVFKQLMHLVREKLITRETIHRAIVDCVVREIQDITHSKNWTQQNEVELAAVKQQINEMKPKFYKIQDVRLLTELLFDFFEELPYNPLGSEDIDHMIQLRNQKGRNAKQILLSAWLIHNAGHHLVCSICKLIDFLKFLAQSLDEKKIRQIITRFVKCLASKKKYSPRVYDGRRYVKESKLSDKESFLVKWLEELVHQTTINSESIELKIKKIDVDLHYHFSSNKKQFYSHSQIKQICDKVKLFEE